jgi:hypothetical protein
MREATGRACRGPLPSPLAAFGLRRDESRWIAGADGEPAGARGEGASRMATCKQCDNEVDALVSVKVAGKAKKMCEDCADRAREEAEVAEQSESVVQNMMGFKGRR